MGSGLFERKDYWTKSEPLLQLESSSTGIGMPAITTITFFTGASIEAAAKSVRERLELIVKANPFVAGRVVKRRGEKLLQLVMPAPDTSVPGDVMAELVRVNPPGMSSLSPNIPYEKLVKQVTVSSAVVPQLPMFSYMFRSQAAAEILNTRVTLVSDPSNMNAFALIFSMSHTVVDGDSYYKIMNMLSEAAVINTLSAARKHDASPKMIEAQGEEDYRFMNGKLILKAMSGMLLAKRSVAYSFFVDEDKMKIAKAQAVAQEKPGPLAIKFVSSNDVLVSTFAKLEEARLFCMAMQFRGRVEGLNVNDAGNYETAMLLDKEVYASPVSLRRVLAAGAPFRAHGKPLPGVLELLRSNIATVSNWSAFAGQLTIAGCVQHLHLPVIPVDSLPIDCMCIYRPTPSRLAVFIGTKRFSRDQLKKAMPLDEGVSEALFGHN